MPLYEFKCECGNIFNEMLKIDDRNNPVNCKCGKLAKRQLTVGNLVNFDKYGRSKGTV